MPIAVGSKAPDFTLKTKAADGPKDVKLSDTGKHQTVLLVLPRGLHRRLHHGDVRPDGRPGGRYEKLGATVYGISVDGPFAQEAWAKQNKIGITLLSDQNKTVIKAYGVVFPTWSACMRPPRAPPSSSARTVW